MDKPEKIINRLRTKGIEIGEISKAGQGRNGVVYKLSGTHKEVYCLKIINGKRLPNGNSRAAQEAEFTKYLDGIDTKRHPELQEYDPEENWILTKWIAGENIQKFDKKNIEQVIRFIVDINAKEHKNARHFLKNAIDRYKSVDDCINDISKRFDNYSKKFAPRSNEWEIDILKNYIDKSIENAKRMKPAITDKCWWSAKETELIASPSDIGVHNTLIKDGRLFFFDFEYGGLDDMSKLICDLVLQPECIISKDIEEIILKMIEQDREEKNWLKRYETIKPLNIAKWTLIILNGDNTRTINVEKALQYYEKATKSNLD